MCVSTAPAKFSGTTLYVGRVRHPHLGLVEVLGYQNTAVSLAARPNAMLLHLPARSMAPGQFLGVGRNSDVLQRMVEAVRPPARAYGGMDWMGAAPQSRSAVQVFDHDIYTVLLAADPTAIPAALERVAPRKRPALQPELMRFYAELYPGYAMAVCCFDTAEARQAKPLLLWYPPRDPELLAAPAVDSHSGGPPDLEERVDTDHWVLFGVDDPPADWGAPVSYGRGMRRKLRAFLPDRVVGGHYTDPLPNGDFVAERRALLDRGHLAVQRRGPVSGS